MNYMKRNLVIGFLIIIIICILVYLFFKKKENFTTYENFEYCNKLTNDDIKHIKKGQLKMGNMLKKFDDICQKHKIRYFLI